MKANAIGPYELGRVHHADCLEAMRQLPDGSLDAILTDPPYGTTRNKWDEPVDWRTWFRAAWKSLRRTAPVVSLVDFNTACEMRCVCDKFRFEMVWTHNLPTGHLNTTIRPMLAHLFVVVFCREPPPWFPQFGDGPKSHKRRSAKHASGTTYGKHDRTSTVIDGRKWPTTVLDFDAVHPSVREHASEKPVELAEWMIRSFTEPGAVVCDPFSGGGWQGIAAHKTGRRFIGFDSDPVSVELSNARIASERERLGEVAPSQAKPGQQIGLLGDKE